MTNIPTNVILSRTDHIGDVILTLPSAAVLKNLYPDLKIAFLGNQYTRAVIEACKYVDEFIDVEDFMKKEVTVCGKPPESIVHIFPTRLIAKRAKQLKIPRRIGTTNRIYHWLTCNNLVPLSRKKSSLHEAQLNIKLLTPFGVNWPFTLDEIGHLFGIEKSPKLPSGLADLIDKEKYNIILHPKSQGNGREWGLPNFISLIRLLDQERFKIFVSGVERERNLLEPLFQEVGHLVTDVTGMMNLHEFISFINHCDGLVASGTGPIHIAAALGKDAYGIYPPLHGLSPIRWSPLGPKAKAFNIKKECNACVKTKMACDCIRNVHAAWISDAIVAAAHGKSSNIHVRFIPENFSPA